MLSSISDSTQALFGEVDDTICNKAQQYVSAIMVKWIDLRLSMDIMKIHRIEDHLVAHMRLVKGIGCFIEDFIKQAHQFGMQEKKNLSICVVETSCKYPQRMGTCITICTSDSHEKRTFYKIKTKIRENICRRKKGWKQNRKSEKTRKSCLVLKMQP